MRDAPGMTRHAPSFWLAVILFVVSSVPGLARADRYVRQGATGDGSGRDWTNACPGLTDVASHPCSPSSLERGATYYLAAGSYGDVRFATPDSGEAWITLRSATARAHGDGEGWEDRFAGQAVFGGITFAYDRYELDGVQRNESDWQDVESYGIRIAFGVAIPDTESATSQTDHVVLRYVDIGAPIERVHPDLTEFCIKPIGAPGREHGHITLHRAHCHNVSLPFHSRFTHDVLIEYVHVGPSWGKEVISHQYGDDWIVRHFVWRDNGLSGDESLTAEIGVFNYTGGASPDDVHADRWQVYSGVIEDTDTLGTIAHNDAVISAGNVHGWRVYNLTLVNLGERRDDIIVNGTGNVVHNILFAPVGVYGDGAYAATVNVVATEASHIWCRQHELPGRAGLDCDRLAATWPGSVSSMLDPFVDLAGGDLRLRTGVAGSPVNAGVTLGAGFDDVDMHGVVRGADGAWDIGAFEVGAPSARPDAGATAPSDAGVSIAGDGGTARDAGRVDPGADAGRGEPRGDGGDPGVSTSGCTCTTAGRGQGAGTAHAAAAAAAAAGIAIAISWSRRRARPRTPRP
jgi:hypothetical protein